MKLSIIKRIRILIDHRLITTRIDKPQDIILTVHIYKAYPENMIHKIEAEVAFGKTSVIDLISLVHHVIFTFKTEVFHWNSEHPVNRGILRNCHVLT